MSEEKPKRKRGRPKGVTGRSKANSTSFKKGDVNNPKGKAKADHTLRDIIRARGPEVGEVLFQWLHDETKDFNDRLKVLDRILDRGWGKVPTPIDGPEGGNNGQVTILLSGSDADL